MSSNAHSPSSIPAPIVPLVAGWLVPGLGHVLMQRRPHGLVFGGAVLACFVLGMLVSGGTAIDPVTHDVYWLVQHGLGLPFLVTNYLGLYAEARLGDNVTINQQTIGVGYLAVGALLNMVSLAELVRHDPRRRMADAESVSHAEAA